MILTVLDSKFSKDDRILPELDINYQVVLNLIIELLASHWKVIPKWYKMSFVPMSPKGNMIFDSSRFEIRKTKKMKKSCPNRIENQTWYLYQVVLSLINRIHDIDCPNEGFLIKKSQNMRFTKVRYYAFLAILNLIL